VGDKTSEPNEIQILTQLGLTNRQARVYVTLTKIGEANTQKIAAYAKIDRANAYRTIFQLEKLGLLEKIIAIPALYKAISIHEVIPVLLEHKEREYKEIKEKTKEILKKRIENNEKRALDKEPELTLIPPGKAMERKISEIFNHTQISFDFIFTWRDMKLDITKAKVTWKKLVEKGVAVRLIIHTPESAMLKKNIFITDSLFKIRYVSVPPPAMFALFDDKTVLITTTAINPRKAPLLWTTNAGFTKIAKEYFELIWSRST